MKEDYDGAEPSGNSVAVNALLQLAGYTGESAFEEAANDALSAFSSRITQQSMTIPQMLCALIRQAQPQSEITFTGEAAELRREANRHFQPFLILKSEPGETASAVVCKDFVCSPAGEHSGGTGEAVRLVQRRSIRSCPVRQHSKACRWNWPGPELKVGDPAPDFKAVDKGPCRDLAWRHQRGARLQCRSFAGYACLRHADQEVQR